MMPRKRSILREEASEAIKTLKRLKCTKSSVRIDRMDAYLAIYHKIPDASSRYPLSMSKASRSISREEEFRGTKTLIRLDNTNPSVGIDGMNDY
jgi:hypothetical protein